MEMGNFPYCVPVAAGMLDVFMGKPISENIIVNPLAPVLLPLGGGSAYDASVLPVQTFSAFLRTGITALSQPVCLGGRAKPLER